jgi:iron complex transport system substrate-binding protein
MKKISMVLLVISAFVLSSCVTTSEPLLGEVSFSYENDIITLSFDTSLNSRYESLLTSLESINKDSKVAVLTSSTANLFFELGINMDGIPTSNTLTPGLNELVQANEVVTLGNVYQLNLEVLTALNPDVIFMADSLQIPQTLAGYNVVSLPQSYYYDIFLTLSILEEVFEASETIQPILKSLAEKHTEAFSYVEEDSQSIRVGIVQTIYGQLLYNNNQSLVGSITSMLPVHNVFETFSEPNGTLNLEILLEQNPKYLIVHGFGDNPDAALAFFLSLIRDEEGLWQSLDAVKNNRIIVLTSELIGPSADLKVTHAFLEISRTLFFNETSE